MLLKQGDCLELRRIFMKIPKKVKIGWKQYKIVKTVPKVELAEVSNHYFGYIDCNQRNIHLNVDFDKQQQEATLIHEIFHGISEMYNLNFSEEVVEQLGDAFYTLMCDNPEMFR